MFNYFGSEKFHKKKRKCQNVQKRNEYGKKQQN